MAHITESIAPADCVGPEYRPKTEKPTATMSTQVLYDNVHILPQTPQLIALLTYVPGFVTGLHSLIDISCRMIRDRSTARADFIFYSNRIIRLLVEEGLNHFPVIEHTITTPVGRSYAGVKFQGKICGVSIMRAGEAMEQGLRDCCRSVRIGKILIQRDEDTSKPKLFYDKLPEDISERWVLLLDPMFATGMINNSYARYIRVRAVTSCFLTGGSATMAVDVLKSRGVPEDRILFLNVIASPEGVTTFARRFPRLRVVTAFVDQGLDEKKYACSLNCDFQRADKMLATLSPDSETLATASTHSDY